MTELNRQKTQLQVKGVQFPPLEELDSLLTDEFQFYLNEAMNMDCWLPINKGSWQNRIEFFSYLDKEFKKIYELKNKPYQLEAYFNQESPNLKQSGVNDIIETNACDKALDSLQQIFLINALRILVKKHSRKDSSLDKAVYVLKTLLISKIAGEILNIASTLESHELKEFIHDYEKVARINAILDISNHAEEIRSLAQAIYSCSELEQTVKPIIKYLFENTERALRYNGSQYSEDFDEFI